MVALGTGIDIKEKKMTLPLIYSLRNASWMDRKRIVGIIKNESHKPKKVQEVIEFVKNSGGIEYATSVMDDFYKKALDTLKYLEESIYRESLENLVQFTIERTK